MSLLKTNEIQNYNGSSLTLTASTVSTSAQLNTGGNISVTGSLNVSDDSTTRTNLGLGSMATQNANAVAITGGTINTVQPATGQSLTIKDEDGNTAIIIGTDNTAAGYLSLNFGSYHGDSGGAGSGTLSSNTLDDYEHGTWTPGIATSATQPTGIIYNSSFNRGWYTKIGNQVTITFSLYIDNKGSGGTGALRLTGFPFNSTLTNASVSVSVAPGKFNTTDPVFLSGTWSSNFQTFQTQTTSSLVSVNWSAVQTDFSALGQTTYLL